MRESLRRHDSSGRSSNRRLLSKGRRRREQVSASCTDRAASRAAPSTQQTEHTPIRSVAASPTCTCCRLAPTRLLQPTPVRPHPPPPPHSPSPPPLASHSPPPPPPPPLLAHSYPTATTTTGMDRPLACSLLALHCCRHSIGMCGMQSSFRCRVTIPHQTGHSVAAPAYDRAFQPSVNKTIARLLISHGDTVYSWFYV